MSNNNEHEHDEDEGKYWWFLPLIGFVAFVGFMMAEMAFFAALP